MRSRRSAARARASLRASASATLSCSACPSACSSTNTPWRSCRFRDRLNRTTTGVYHCFDRIVIFGYLPLWSRPEHIVYFSEVRERFGEPLRSREIRKTDEAIWGPIEDFRPQVPMGGTVEIWSYRTTHEWAEGSGNRDVGTSRLYFVDGSPRVAGPALAPDGVVYEAAEPPSSH